MGAGQSSQTESTSPQPSKNTQKVEMFSVIFMRLLKNTDILDIRALTKGPGACGDYIILLSKELNKEFSTAKLNATKDGSTGGIQDFLYARSKVVTNTSATDEAACTSLAIFYMRALQLVAALTLSIYTPPDLVSRVRNQVFQTGLKKQMKTRPLTLEEREAQKVKREDWFRRFLSPVGASKEMFTFIGRPNLKYDRIHQIITYTANDLSEWKVKVTIKEPNEYNIEDEKIKADRYWVELTNPTTGEVIYRGLVASDNSVYLYSNKAPASDEVEEPFEKQSTWLNYVVTIVATSGAFQAAPVVVPRNNTRNRGRGFFGLEGGRRTRKMRGGVDKNATNTTLSLSPSTQLPRGFQDSYKSMVQWSGDFAKWAEAAPASYRAVLLYIQPTPPSTTASSYLCVDNWADKKMRFIPPFAALETLYYDYDDGTPSPENQTKLSNLTKTFNKLYHPGGAENPSDRNFLDVTVASLDPSILSSFCGKRSAQGDVIVDPRAAAILQKAQAIILDDYKEYFENAYNLISEVFILSQNTSGKTIVKFSDTFTKSTMGARAQLELTITKGRNLIAEHYLHVEETYSGALKEIATLSRA